MPDTNKNRKAVVAAAIEFCKKNGSRMMPDGYPSYVVADDRELQAAVAELLREGDK